MTEPTGLDLSSILQSANQYNQAVASATVGLQKNATTGESVSNQNADLYNVIGTNATIIDQAKQNAELATQQARVKGANALGTNLKEQSEVLTSLADTIGKEYIARSQAKAAIDEKRSVSLFTDPLQWIMNQFTINDDIEAYNSHNENLASAKQQMADLNALTQSTNKTQNELSEPITAASIKASSDNLLATAQIKANEEKLKGLVYNSEGIKAALNADKEMMATAFSVFGAQKQEQNINIALAHLELQRQEFDWRKIEKEKGEAADAYLIDKINKGAAMRLGDSYVPIPPGSVKAAQIVSLIKSNSPAGKQFLEDFQIGDQSDLAGTKIIAPSPARAIDVLNSMPVKLSPAQAPVKGVLDQTLQAVQAQIQAGKLDPKNKEGIQSFMNKTAQELLDSQAKLVKPGDSDNVYQIPALRTVIASSPTLQNLPLVQKVIGPAVATGADLNDPNQVFALTAKALTDKKITYPEALELTTLYQTAQNVNLEARQLPSLGLRPKFSYNVKVQTNPIARFGDTEVVDVTKPDLVGRALNKYMAAQANPFAQNEWR